MTSRGAGFRLRFLGEVDGRLAERDAPLARVHSVRFERARPVREFPTYCGQRNFPGLWWSSTMRDLVGYETWLERPVNRTNPGQVNSLLLPGITDGDRQAG